MLERLAPRRILAIWLLSCCVAEGADGSAEKPAPSSKPAESRVAAPAEGAKPATTATSESVETLVKRVLPSIVIVRGAGREGREDGLGTGFVIDRGGLIATNLHVIGEGRAIAVETVDGRRLEPTAVYASDRNLDLAVLRVDAELPPLKLGDSEAVDVGQDIVVLGNPQGLTHSVVKGVVSGSREIEGLPLLQLAVPIEQGNSGGPVIDRGGRVLGVVTMKSQVTDNLGFAVKINSLKPLLEKPNTVTMDRWLTIGALDPKRWRTVGGARWKQRAGRILVDGVGSGFGGRSLCLTVNEPPKEPFEVAVSVKLDDESGAAGLAFAADGDQRHFGFYPTGGRLRLTRFEGPDVYSWQVLEDRPSEAYRPGEWNRLRVRIEANRLTCYVNETKLFEHETTDVAGRRVGLAKFRQTEAEFKQFAVGASLAVAEPPAALTAAVAKLGERSVDGTLDRALLEPIAAQSEIGAALLRRRAAALQQEAKLLGDAAAAVERQAVVGELSQLLKQPDRKIDLLRGALLIAKLDNSEVDVDAYREQVDRMAREIRERLPSQADDDAKLAALNKYLFDENGYHGSRRDYYSRSNSYLNEVIDDREGLPITLSLLYIEVGRRLGLKLEGIGLPGHFIVALVADDPDGGEPLLRYFDPFEGGARLTEADAVLRSREITGRAPAAPQLRPAAHKAVLLRMLENLLGQSDDEAERPRLLGYLDVILAAAPDNLERRMVRAMIRYRSGRIAEAVADVDYLLEHHREAIDEERVLELRDRMERERRSDGG